MKMLKKETKEAGCKECKGMKKETKAQERTEKRQKLSGKGKSRT